MTAPVPPPIPLDWPTLPTWCSVCPIHQATTHRPVCPVCLDDQRRAEQ